MSTKKHDVHRPGGEVAGELVTLEPGQRGGNARGRGGDTGVPRDEEGETRSCGSSDHKAMF